MNVLQYDDKSNLIFIEFFKEGVCCCVSGTTFSFLEHSSAKAVPENSFWDIVQLFMVRCNYTNNKHDILTRSKRLCDPSAGLTALRTSVLFNIASFSVWAWNKKHSWHWNSQQICDGEAKNNSVAGSNIFASFCKRAVSKNKCNKTATTLQNFVTNAFTYTIQILACTPSVNQLGFDWQAESFVLTIFWIWIFCFEKFSFQDIM